MFGLPSLGAGPMRAFRLPAPAEGQGGIDAADAVAGGGVENVVGAVAEEQERKRIPPRRCADRTAPLCQAPGRPRRTAAAASAGPSFL